MFTFHTPPVLAQITNPRFLPLAQFLFETKAGSLEYPEVFTLHSTVKLEVPKL
ncbi:hypothetical protein D3C85_912060 [compost metagenome]